MSILVSVALATWASVSAYPWPLVVVIAIVVFPFALVAIKKLAPPVEQHSDQGRSFMTAASPERAEATATEFRFVSSDELELLITPEAMALLAIVINHSRRVIHNCKVSVTDARSYDLRKPDDPLRDSWDFKRKKIATYLPIPPGDIATTNAFQRTSVPFVRINGGQLEVGDTVNDGILKWPRADLSSVQIWLLEVHIEADGLRPTTIWPKLHWNRSTNEIRLTQGL